MLTRREYLRSCAALGAACALPGGVVRALEPEDLITRAIPKTGEQLPVVGLGSSATFRQVAQSDDISALAEVMQTLLDNGGTVFDTAPSYGASEEDALEKLRYDPRAAHAEHDDRQDAMTGR